MATILVIDDEPTNRQLLSTVLGYQGHTIVEASDGQEGLEKSRAAQPDLAIVDILMPTMDGFEFVRQLRSAKSGSRAKREKEQRLPLRYRRAKGK